MWKERYISSFVQQLFNKNDKLSCVYTKKTNCYGLFKRDFKTSNSLWNDLTSVINVGRAFFKCWRGGCRRRECSKKVLFGELLAFYSIWWCWCWNRFRNTNIQFFGHASLTSDYKCCLYTAYQHKHKLMCNKTKMTKCTTN